MGVATIMSRCCTRCNVGVATIMSSCCTRCNVGVATIMSRCCTRCNVGVATIMSRACIGWNVGVAIVATKLQSNVARETTVRKVVPARDSGTIRYAVRGGGSGVGGWGECQNALIVVGGAVLGFDEEVTAVSNHLGSEGFVRG